MNELGIAVALVVGPLGHFFGQRFQSQLKRLHLGKCLHGHFHDGRLFVVFHLLGQVANAVLLGGVDVPFRGFLQASNDFEQRGFAGAIAAHKANAVFGANGQVHTLKQRTVPKMDPQRCQVEHRVQVRSWHTVEQKREAQMASLFYQSSSWNQ